MLVLRIYVKKKFFLKMFKINFICSRINFILKVINENQIFEKLVKLNLKYNFY